MGSATGKTDVRVLCWGHQDRTPTGTSALEDLTGRESLFDERLVVAAAGLQMGMLISYGSKERRSLNGKAYGRISDMKFWAIESGDVSN